MRKFQRHWLFMVVLCSILAFGKWNILAYATTQEWNIYQDTLYYEITSQEQVIIKSARPAITEAIIPSQIDGYPVVEIEGYAFKDCTRLKKVVLPDTLRQIGEFAFKDCIRLETLIIPDTVEKIGWGAVQGTLWLENQDTTFVIAGKGILLAYNGTEEQVVIPEGVCAIGGYAFDSCVSMKTVQFPCTLRSVDAFAFINCLGLEQVQMVDGLKSIGEYAFHWCTSLRKVVLPDTVTTVSGQAFSYCKSLESVQLSVSMTQISIALFRGCQNLREITIPDGVQIIYNYAFEECTSLKTLILPKSVREIGMKVFEGCDSLEKVMILNPECRIYDEKTTIIDTAKIYGMLESTAHVYAQKYARQYEALDCKKGDMDKDGWISTMDVYQVLHLYAENAAGTPHALTLQERYMADYNGDDVIDTMDAYAILLIYVKESAGV